MYLPILRNTEWTCTMDSFVHCKNLESKIDEAGILQEARDYARDKYKGEVENPYNMVNLLNWLKEKWSIDRRFITKYPTIGDIVVAKPDAYDMTGTWRHAACIIDDYGDRFLVALWDWLIQDIEKSKDYFYYTFRYGIKN